jgi:hypothetical protein
VLQQRLKLAHRGLKIGSFAVDHVALEGDLTTSFYKSAG